MITRKDIEGVIRKDLGLSELDAEVVIDVIGRHAAIVPRKPTHEMLMASIREDRNLIEAAIAEGDLTK